MTTEFDLHRLADDGGPLAVFDPAADHDDADLAEPVTIFFPDWVAAENARLRTRIAELEALAMAQAERIAVQSELLSRRSEVPTP